MQESVNGANGLLYKDHQQSTFRPGFCQLPQGDKNPAALASSFPSSLNFI
jgi:hypothetical protein